MHLLTITVQWAQLCTVKLCNSAGRYSKYDLAPDHEPAHLGHGGHQFKITSLHAQKGEPMQT